MDSNRNLRFLGMPTAKERVKQILSHREKEQRDGGATLVTLAEYQRLLKMDDGKGAHQKDGFSYMRSDSPRAALMGVMKIKGATSYGWFVVEVEKIHGEHGEQTTLEEFVGSAVKRVHKLMKDT